MLRSEVSHSLDHHSSHCHYYLLPEQDALVKIAKKLKKNNVAVDIVSFGCEVRPSSLSSALALLRCCCRPSRVAL